MEKILEILEKLNNVIGDVTINSDTLRKGTEKLEKAYEKLKEVITVVSDKFLEFKNRLKEKISNKLDVVKKTFLKIKGAVGRVKSGIQGAIFKVKSFIGNVQNGAKKIKDSFAKVKGYIKQVIDVFKQLSPVLNLRKKLMVLVDFLGVFGGNSKGIVTLSKVFKTLSRVARIASVSMWKLSKNFNRLSRFFKTLSLLASRFASFTRRLRAATIQFRKFLLVASTGLKKAIGFGAYTKSVTNLTGKMGALTKGAGSAFRRISLFSSKLKVLGSLNPFTRVLLYLPLAIDLFKKFKTNLEPIIGSLTYLAERINNFINAMFPLQEGSYLFEAIRIVLDGVGAALSFVSLGLSIVFEMLQPYAKYIGMVVASWAALNAIMLLSPTTWIVIGVVALIAAIAIAIKYTKGWGTAWQGLKDIASGIWAQMKNDFGILVNSIGYFFELAFLKIVSFGQRAVQFVKNIGESIKLAWQGNFSEAKDKLNEKIETKAQKQIEDLQKRKADADKQYVLDTVKNLNTVAGGLKKIQSLSFDKKGFVKDFKGVKNNFSFSGSGKTGNAGPSFSSSPSIGTQQSIGGITAGGKKQTNINVQFDKLIEQLNITTETYTESIDEMEDKVKEALLRILNSSNQLQIN